MTPEQYAQLLANTVLAAINPALQALDTKTQNRVIKELNKSLISDTLITKIQELDLSAYAQTNQLGAMAFQANVALTNLASDVLELIGTKASQQDFDTIVAIIGSESDDLNSFISNVRELLAIMANYPEGIDLMQLLASKITQAEADAARTGAVLDIRAGVDVAGDNLAKVWAAVQQAISDLQGKASQETVDAINTIIGDPGGDGDNAVNKLREALVILQNFAEGADVAQMITDLQSAIGGKAPTAHNHDDRYYTETEINTLLADKLSEDTSYASVAQAASITIDCTARKSTLRYTTLTAATNITALTLTGLTSGKTLDWDIINTTAGMITLTIPVGVEVGVSSKAEDYYASGIIEIGAGEKIDLFFKGLNSGIRVDFEKRGSR